MANACNADIDIGFAKLDAIQVSTLGIVQGVTELLPISSTAHMRIVPTFLGWPDPGSPFSAAMQLAALFAVVSYFWKDVVAVVGGTMRAARDGNYSAFEFRLGVGIVIATIPIVIGGLLLKKQLNLPNSPLRALWVIGAASLVMAALLALAELVCRHKRSFEEIRLRDAVIVGLAQVGALIPGVSRSGSSLTAALFLNLKREDAARFSFLLGLPAIFGAGVKELLELRHSCLDAQGWEILGIGLGTASLSAFVAIWSLMKIMEKFSAWPFVIYRALMGGFLLLCVWLGVLE